MTRPPPFSLRPELESEPQPGSMSEPEQSEQKLSEPRCYFRERDDANKEGIDASAVAADHIAAELETLDHSDWRPCMVRKGTFLQGILQKLPSKRAGIHGWQRRFMTLKDKELRYYEHMVRVADRLEMSAALSATNMCIASLVHRKMPRKISGTN